MALGLLIGKTKTLELRIQSEGKFTEKLSAAKAQTFALLRISEIFADKFAEFRMLCPLLYYLDYLNVVGQDSLRKVWQPPYGCFDAFAADLDKAFRIVRDVLARDHYQIIEEYLSEKGESDRLVIKLRDRSPTMMRLQWLLGDRLNMLWKDKEIRAKLLNKKCIINNQRFLSKLLIIKDICQKY